LKTVFSAFIVITHIIPTGAIGVAKSVTMDPHHQFVSRTWSIDNGLPANGVLALLRTQDGYLWIGTEGGLVRFNGDDFHTFDPDRFGDLSYQGVTCLAESDDGGIWIGTWGGGLYLYDKDNIKQFTTENGLGSNYIKALLLDENNKLWVGTRRGLNLIENDHIESPFLEYEFLYCPIMCLSRARNGDVFIGTWGNGLVRASESGDHSYTRVSFFEHQRVTALCLYDQDNLLIGTDGHGTFILSDSSLVEISLPEKMQRAAITAIRLDFNGDIWIGSQNNLLLRLNIDHITTVPQSLDSFQVSAWSIHIDNERNIWVGTDHNGLIQLYESAVHMVSPGSSPDMKRVSAIAQDRDGYIWLGTEESGLYVQRQGRMIHIQKPSEVSDDIVTMLKRLPDKSLLVNFLRSGLFTISEGELSKLVDADDIPANIITDAIQYDEDTIIMSINGYGILNIVNGTVQTNTYNSRLSSRFATCITRTGDGSIWVGTFDRGINRCIGDSVIFIDEQYGLSNNSIRHLYGDTCDDMWICTYGGGINHIGIDGCTNVTMDHGLHSRFVYQMIDDGIGGFWFSSNKGIFAVPKDTLAGFVSGRIRSIECMDFGKNDGLSTLECNGAGGFRSDDDRIWFPTTRGAAIIDPRNIRKNSVVPPIYIEDILIDGEYRLHQRCPTTVTERVTSGQNRLEFRFAALSLVEPEKVQFRYRLLGFDDDWIYGGNNHSAYYTNLPYGEYTFEVIASNDDGIWNSDGARHSFSVHRRFHETWLFLALCSLGCIVTGAGLYSFRVRQLRARQKKLQRLVQQKTQDLREANQRLERLANLDGLTGVANRRSFDRLLEAEWKRALRLEEPISLVFVDIDYFKAYNDTYGHIAGDECLKTVARCLDSNVRRSGDLVARYGGEEFAVLLPNLPEDKAAGFAEDLRINVESQSIAHDGSAVCDTVTISIGVATMIPSKSDPPSRLVDEADNALYRAKHKGRNRVESGHDQNM